MKMDRFLKIIASLHPKMRKRVLDTIKLLQAHQIQGLDIRKMQGYDHVFRCRLGDIRIIFRKYNETIKVLDVDFRGNIYKRWK